MTDWMGTLSHSRLAVILIFGACTILSVSGLEFFRAWLARAPREERGGRGEAIVATLVWNYRLGLPLGDAEEERRRTVAHDL